MDIRNWPMDRIMQLPDCCFGRRWPIVFSDAVPAPGGAFYFISEIALPEKCILWELEATTRPLVVEGTVAWFFALKLGDKQPASDAEFTAMEDMLPGCDAIDFSNRVIHNNLSLRRLRMPIISSGRRVVLRVDVSDYTSALWAVGLVFSSFPTEVPDCLLSV
ncbi:hypothetical protein ES708_04778 [subsurface metagenome]